MRAGGEEFTMAWRGKIEKPQSTILQLKTPMDNYIEFTDPGVNNL